MTPHADFTSLPDLASRTLAGSVVYANDELFAQRENLIKPERSVFAAEEFGHKGKVYDGWETRRRRERGEDIAIVRLGVPGVVKGVVIDTSWFTGNYPPFASVEGASFEGYPSTDELLVGEWYPLVAKSPIRGDTDNPFPVEDPRRFTHVRLTMYPDGGVARFRVHGQPVPDPRFLTATLDLAALENGGDVIDCSNRFYSSPLNILQPGRARIMGDGWENARRRDDGNDHVTVQLAATGHVDLVEIDTSYFVGNAAGWASLRGRDASTTEAAGPGAASGSGRTGEPSRSVGTGETDWVELVPRTRLQPDTRHLFRVRTDTPVDQVRLDVFPDGGLARLRVHGRISDGARAEAVTRWLDLLPQAQADSVLTGDGGLEPERAHDLSGQRPFTGTGVLPPEVVGQILS